jgi:hypothetical protein
MERSNLGEFRAKMPHHRWRLADPRPGDLARAALPLAEITSCSAGVASLIGSAILNLNG